MDSRWTHIVELLREAQVLAPHPVSLECEVATECLRLAILWIVGEGRRGVSIGIPLDRLEAIGDAEIERQLLQNLAALMAEVHDLRQEEIDG